ncbi:multiple sugar transport system substrate-binding protein [Amycolatopsis arida]|uniref:Multiple sugar transport system substrate-binding protein n=1 Tax=Amycolatopsis arida TaxID=587909 RepID=A0A1I5LY19_9PSEU|nr:ABC transporter substrate-binding protein [Amycolatopsis arida]TDX93892.1 multiple sugar transport system substrate-binding protein [Amycolatopsis arida]SFP02132.1 multiple sugar transport system substrate-binding protein [Amycolatopsis arida]
MRRALTAALAAVALVTTACGGGGDAPATGTNDGRGPITFATLKDGTGTVPKLVAEWNAAHPDEQVRIVELPEGADGQRQQLVQQAQTRSDAYDVITIDLPWNAEFAARRWITELPAERFDVDGFLPSPLEGSHYRGQLYSIPHFTGAGMLYYRTDLLDRAGQRPPATWDELRAVCAAVLALPEAEGMSCYAGQHDKYEGLTVNFAEAVGSAGGEVTDERGNPRLDTPAATAGLEFLVEGFRSGVIPADAITFKEEEGRRAFQQGGLVFHRNWAYIHALMSATDGSSEVAGKFGVTVLPGAGGPGVSTLGGNNLAVSTFSTKQATARDFIAYLTSVDTQREHAKGSAYPMTRAAIYADPVLREKYPYLEVLEQSIRSARPRPELVRYGDATAAIQDSVYAAQRDEVPVEQALATLQGRLAEIAQGS